MIKRRSVKEKCFPLLYPPALYPPKVTSTVYGFVPFNKGSLFTGRVVPYAEE